MNFARLLVFNPDLAGDPLLVAPALELLRKRRPEARIILATRLPKADVARLTPFVDQVIQLSRGSDSIGEIGETHCDGAIIFTARGESPHPDGYRCYLAGIPFRAGMSSEFAGGVLSHWVKPLPNTKPPVDPYLALVASIGAPVQGATL